MDEQNNHEQTPGAEALVEPDYPKIFGALLRETREKAGYSVQQLAESTRILLTFIEALEAGDFAKLPGAVFGRGFIKSLSKTLGADPKPLLLAFDQACGKKPETASSLNVPVDVSVAKVKLFSERANGLVELKDSLFDLIPADFKQKLTPKAAAWGAGVIVALAAFAYVISLDGPKKTANLEEKTLKQEVAETAQVEEEPTAEAPTTAEFADKALEPPVGEIQPEAPTEKSAEIAAPAEVKKEEPKTEESAQYLASAESGQSGPQLLELAVKQPLKVRIRIDAEKWTTTQLEPNNYQFRFNKTAEVLVFNAAAVEILFNGKPLGSLGKEGRVRRLSFVATSEAAPEAKKL